VIDPSAIIKLESPTTVETPDGLEENVTRLAVWDWWTKDVDDQEMVRAHTNRGDIYFPASAIEEINDLDQ